jgi:hypothetical protein
MGLCKIPGLDWSLSSRIGQMKNKNSTVAEDPGPRLMEAETGVEVKVLIYQRQRWRGSSSEFFDYRGSREKEREIDGGAARRRAPPQSQVAVGQ